MSKSGVIAGDQLRTIIERIENIDGEIKELTEARKEVYLEAKGNGFDVKTVREVIRIRKQDQQEVNEQQILLELYLEAIKVSKRAAKAGVNDSPRSHRAPDTGNHRHTLVLPDWKRFKENACAGRWWRGPWSWPGVAARSIS